MAISAKDVKTLRERTDAPMMECKSALEEAQGDIEQAVKVLRERGLSKMAKRAGRETSEGVVGVHVGPTNKVGTAVVVTCETDFTAKNENFSEMVDKVLGAASGIAGGELSVDQVLAADAGGVTAQACLDDVKNTTRENMALKECVRFDGVCGMYRHFDQKSAALIEVELGDESKSGSDELTGLLREICMHIVAVDPPPLAVNSDDIEPQVIEDEKAFLIKQAMDSGKPKEIAEKMVAGRMRKFFEERALVQQPFVKAFDKTITQVLEEGGKAVGTTIKVKRFVRLSIGG